MNLVQSILFDVEEEVEIDVLVPLLQHLNSASLRHISFTSKTTVCWSISSALLWLYRRHINVLDTMVIPSCRDHFSLEYPNRRPRRILRPWNFFEKWSDKEIRELKRYNARLIQEGENGWAPCKMEQTGDMGLVVKLRKKLDSKRDAGKELEVFMSSFAPADICRELVTEKKGRNVVALNVDNSARYDTVIPLGSVFEGLGLNPLKLEQLRLTLVDLTEYGQAMLAHSARSARSRAVIRMLELIKLYDCDGITEFLDGCRIEPPKTKTFIFIESDRRATDEEIRSLTDYIKACSNLDTLCLEYSDFKEPTINDAADQQQTFRSNELPLERQDWWAEENDTDEDAIRTFYCNMGLTELLPSIKNTIKSLSLSQGLYSKFTGRDLRLIASECGVLTDLGLPFPHLTEGEAQDVMDGLEEIAVSCVRESLPRMILTSRRTYSKITTRSNTSCSQLLSPRTPR